MAATAAMLKTATEPPARSATRATPRPARTSPAERPRPRRARIDDRLSLIALAPKAGEIVLDLGCGTGRRFNHLLQAGSMVVGIDSSLAALRAAGKKFSESGLVFNETWESLPFVSGHFDAVLCTLAGEHLERLAAVLRELHRVLKPGGRIVLALHYPELATREEAPAKRHAGVQNQLFEVDLALRTGAFRHTAQDYLAALKAAHFTDIRQHKTAAHGRQQSLFPEENRLEQEDFPNLIVLQAVRPK